MQNKKQRGQVFTPRYIVDNMLDFMGYTSNNVLKKHIMENSCGAGSFLSVIVERYILEYLKNDKDVYKLKEELETYIHGIEIDKNLYDDCLQQLTEITSLYQIPPVDWDIVCGDTLMIFDKYSSKMDFVVGNPPYVRVHNLDNAYDTVKKFLFTTYGMTDLYLAFFEIGFQMLNKNGKICLITPSSCLKSKAGQVFRNYIQKHKNLEKIIDLEHFQPFNATTYTMITLFDNLMKHERFEYFSYDAIEKKPVFVESLNFDNCIIDDKIYLAKNTDLMFLKQVDEHYRSILDKSICVKNGFATLADDIFIGDFDFPKYVINVIKSSTGEWKKCIYPYNEVGKPVSELMLEKERELYAYLYSYKDKLLKRSISDEKDWFLFGRTQAIKDVSKEKIAINQLIKDKSSLKISLVKAGEGIYSGLYILTQGNINQIYKILNTEEFVGYIKSLKNFKSGGYYTFSSQDLEKFLVYKLDERQIHEFKFS